MFLRLPSRIRFLFWAFSLLVFAGCGDEQPTASHPVGALDTPAPVTQSAPAVPVHIATAYSAGVPDPSWWNDAVFYQGFVRSFYDSDGMPDLNYENPDVTAEMQDVIRFWLEDIGADGFRLDGVKHLIEDGRIQENTSATHEWLREFYSFYKSVDPDAMTVGEVWSPAREVVEYVGDQVDVALEFDTAEAMINSAKYEDRSLILRAHRLIAERYPANQLATFLTNHDRERVMSQLDGNVDHAKTAASLLFTGPGVPYVYYGEEIGHVGRKPDEKIRTPMQWTGDDNAGFTTGTRCTHHSATATQRHSWC